MIAGEQMKQSLGYVDRLLSTWGADKHSPKLAACLRSVLSELCPEAHLMLHNPKLQVVIHTDAGFGIWASFPVHKTRVLCKEQLPETRVLLRIDTDLTEEDADFVRDHIGHVLLYLRKPRAKNDCNAATREFDDYRVTQ